MTQITGFVAYPSAPAEIGATIRASLNVLRDEHGIRGLTSWEANDIAGRCVIDPILDQISQRHLLVADITRLNFNVVYEVGYALGLRKRAVLIKNSALSGDDDLIREVGIFDTLGYSTYHNSNELASLIGEITDLSPLPLGDHGINIRVPVYVLVPRKKDEADIRMVSRIKKARLKFRIFDPEEQGRLAARDAIDNVAESHGIIAHLLSSNHVDAKTHNLRAAFVAGISHAMQKQLLLLQAGGDPVPIDYRDSVNAYTLPQQLDVEVAEFATAITARLQSDAEPIASEPRTFLAKLNLGASAAENELGELGHYYLETDEFRRALNGEVQIVAGRKGSGKTALFAQVRNRLRQKTKQCIVLDLKPEGFQLIKFKELVLDLLSGGTKEHTITAFWEYLILLEICQKILEKDKEPHVRDHRLYKPYRELDDAYREDAFVTEGDFAERMLKLIQRISEDFQAALSTMSGRERSLNSAQVTELLYKHDVATLRNRIINYLSLKEGVRVLFDNLDKGWPPHGLTADDILILRCLLDALAKIEREFRRRDIPCSGAIFIRNDVYELLIANTPDRGKVAYVMLDWSDPELFRELLRRRFVYGASKNDYTFEQIWNQICVSHVDGEESSQYIIDRCLMRPRALIELLHHCRSHAVNLGHSKIDLDDIKRGEEAFSTDLVTNIGFEIQDVYPEFGDVLYEFIGCMRRISASELDFILRKAGVDDAKSERFIELLLWYGFLGVARGDGEVSYIYSVKYDMRRLRAVVSLKERESRVYQINPAFWLGLEIA